MRLVVMLGLASVAAGCSGEDPVETRGCSQTGYALDSLTIDAFAGPLASGACTPYEQQVHDVYRYTYVRFVIGQDVFELQPIDFVGETPLSSGRWSYMITIADFANHRADVQAFADD